MARGETAQVGDEAREILALAAEMGDAPAIGAAHGLIGDVLGVQGKLGEALAELEENLAITRQLGEQDPRNADWQRDFAVAYLRVGVVLREQGKLGEALAAFGEALAILRRLAEQDPSNARWQRNLAMACGKMASLHRKAGRDRIALRFYEEAADIFASLLAKFPDNAAWHEDRSDAYHELALCRLFIRGTAEASESPLES